MGVFKILLEKDDNDLESLAQLPWLKGLLTLLKDLQYGSITLIVQDGKLIQMEKNEKIRLC